MTCRDLIFQKSVQILQSHLASLGQVEESFIHFESGKDVPSFVFMLFQPKKEHVGIIRCYKYTMNNALPTKVTEQQIDINRLI